MIAILKIEGCSLNVSACPTQLPHQGERIVLATAQLGSHPSHDRLPVYPSISESSLSHAAFIQAIIEGLIDGIIIVATDGKVIQFNARAAQLWPTLTQTCFIQPSFNSRRNAEEDPLPAAIWRLCEALIGSRALFPNQTLIPESEVQMNSTLIRLRSQWLTIHPTHEASEFDRANLSTQPIQSSIVVTLEDRYEASKHLAMTDMQKYGLTQREREIWQLRLQGQTYREIATQLYITEHTVRKHIKSILAKRRVN
jgi:DNA-binding CsgD family transcriptional regulator